MKRANAAKEVLHDIHVDTRAANAVTMLDWDTGKHHYNTPELGISFVVSYAEVLRAVGQKSEECSDPKDIFIRDCFDWFLYYLDRIEHYIRTEYIDFIDVQIVFRPYARKLLENLKYYQPFLADRDYPLAQAFLQRVRSA